MVDMDSITVVNKFLLPSTSFNSPFSCFQWIHNEAEISLFPFDSMISRFVCDDRTLSLSENEILPSWVVDRPIYHCCIYRVHFHKPEIEVGIGVLFHCSHSILPQKITVMAIMFGQTIRRSIHWVNAYSTLPSVLLRCDLQEDKCQTISLPVGMSSPFSIDQSTIPSFQFETQSTHFSRSFS